MNKHFIFGLLCLFLLGFTFRAVFSASSLSFGDAPYLSQELLPGYLSEPSYWTTLGNSFGGVNRFIWIHPYMAIIAAVGLATNFSPGVLLRLFFVIPAIVLAFGGVYILASRYIQSVHGRLVASLIFSLNSFFLMVIDGGQVGVALAYGLFPGVVTALTYFHTLNKKSVLVSLIALTCITVADPRIALLAVFFSVVLQPKVIKTLSIALPIWVGINMYWIYPLISGGGLGITGAVGPQVTSLLTGLFLFAPHYHQNLYGVISYPTALFALFPLLVLFSFKKPDSSSIRLGMIWLACIFLVKGSTPPFRQVYEFLLSLPFGSAYRDSTKFMIPLALATAVLVARSVDRLPKFGANIFFAAFAFTLAPVLAGNFSFALSGHEVTADIEQVNQEISQGRRTAWIYEHDPRALIGAEKEAVDGKDLADLRPFSRLNVGSGDRMNFLNRTESAHWLDVFGIDYLVVTGNPRIRQRSDSDQADWNRLNTLLSERKDLAKKSDTRVYRNSDVYPLLYGVGKSFIVIGPDSVYEKLQETSSKYRPGDYAHFFVEDGWWDVAELENYSSESAVLINNSNTDAEQALTMSLLSSFFVNSKEANISQFAEYPAQEYLKYKYELLIRDITFVDFDYNRGVAFSTRQNEKLQFPFTKDGNGDYMLAVRAFSVGQPAQYTYGTISGTIPLSESFKWTLVPVSKTANTPLTITNSDGTTVFNVAGLIPMTEYKKAQAKAKGFIEHFGIFTPRQVPQTIFSNEIYKLTYSYQSNAYRNIAVPESVKWIIFTNRYSPDFVLTKDRMDYLSLPTFSSLNALYTRPEWREVSIVHRGQTTVRWGLYISAVFFLSTVLGFIITWKK